MRDRIVLAAILTLASCAKTEGANESLAANAVNVPSQAAARGAAPASEAGAANPSDSAAEHVSPCMLQDGTEVDAISVKGLGTEPFWAVRTKGRCVTYSTPEDQAGTRVWAKVESRAQDTVWTGALRGKPFRLAVKQKPGCSDGMSDNVYPMEAALNVDGEVRTGCAEPL